MKLWEARPKKKNGTVGSYEGFFFDLNQQLEICLGCLIRKCGKQACEGLPAGQQTQ